MSGPAAAGERILVVDDDDTLREILSEQLTDAGFEVTTCPEGGAALAELARQPYHAVLSDLRMPGIEGLSLLRAIRERDPDMPVVLLTGGPSIESAVQALEQGALDYLIKPVPAAKLVDTMSRAVKLGTLARLKRQALITIDFDKTETERHETGAAFDRALASLWMACQPIVRASDGGIHAHEALVRTREPSLPHPGALFDTAERLGRLHELGRTIRERAAQLIVSGTVPELLFMNVHPEDLTDDTLLDPHAPLSRVASRVVLEVTERASLEKMTGVAERIRGLRELGFRIALDDLGAGYAGLTSFATLTPDVVKVDMSLVRDIDGDPLRQKLVASIASLCKSLGILVVGEGIETEGERAAVVGAGCDLLQGYLFGKPAALEPESGRASARDS